MILTGLDVSRKASDKSIITFVKSVPKSIPFACIFLSDVDKIRIIDFPANDQARLAQIIRSSYAYGIRKEKVLDEKCLQFKMQVSLTLIRVGEGGIHPNHFQRLAVLSVMNLGVSNLHVFFIFGV